MTLAVLITIIIIGFILILLEMFVISGTVVPGIIGAGLLISGIVLSYTQFDQTTGHTVLLSSIVFISISMYYLFRAKTWKRAILNSQITSKATSQVPVIKIGDKGIALSRLAPTGKIMINEQILEATTFNTFIDSNTQIEIIQIFPDKIYVKSI